MYKYLSAFVLLFILVMTPFYKSGFTHDDSVNSLMADKIKVLKLSKLDFAISEIKDQFYKGRVQPVGLMLNSLGWSMQPTETNYWIFRICTNLFAICSFALLLTIWGVSLFDSLSMGFLFILFIQARTTHEPIASYGYLPIISGLGFIGLYLGIKSIYKPNLVSLILSSLILFFDVLYYEVSLCFFCILIAISLLKRKKIAIYWLCFPITYLIFLSWVRRTFASQVNSMSIKNPLKFIEASLHQIGGMLPLNHMLFRWPHNLQKTFFLPSISYLFVSILIGFFAYILFKKSNIQKINISNEFSIDIALTALGLILIPTFLIVIVERYREMLSGGAPYIPVYLGYFGMILVFLLIKNKLFSDKKWKHFSFIVGIIICIQTYHNFSIAEIEYFGWTGFRVAFEKELNKKPLNELLENSLVYIGGDICDLYRHPYFETEKNSSFWFKSRFNKDIFFKCVKIQDDKTIPYLEMTTINSTRKYHLKWVGKNMNTFELDI